MKWFSFTGKNQYMKRKLFMYMLVLVALILIIMLAGLNIIGGFTGEKQKTFETLDFQADIFGRQIEAHFDRLAAMGIHLSADTADAIDSCLKARHINFSDINDSEENVAAVQDAVFDILNQRLLEADCSGAFIFLEATVNTRTNAASSSRTGLYLQRSSIEYSNDTVLLYRGLSDLGKARNIMPHRKWRPELDIDDFPGYTELIKAAGLPPTDAYRISDIHTIAGTMERAILLTVPIVGNDSTVYGLCGFEINESYFKYIFAQPSKLMHAVFTFNKGSKADISNANSFCCGISDGYFLSPKGEHTASSFGESLTLFKGKASEYIGVTRPMQLSKSDGFMLSTLIPKQDHDGWVTDDIIQITMIVIIVLIATIGCSYFFTRKFLLPIKKMLEQLKKKEYDGRSGLSEVDDLFVFLSEQDRLREAEFDKMREAYANTRASLENIQNMHDEAVQHIERLAYSRKDEIDPYDFENFKKGLANLTEREKELFELYVAGNTVKEIVALTGLKESTVRFHNKNIYSKLGIHSLKQLLRYSAILKKMN